MIKIKVTYTSGSMIMACIMNISGWYDLPTQLSNNSIMDYDVLKIEKVIQADPVNTMDTTN